MNGLQRLEENHGWMEPLSLLTEDIITGYKRTDHGLARSPHSALFYHGDPKPPEVFVNVMAEGTFINRSRMYDTGIYCVRNFKRCIVNMYGPHLYELYVRGLDNFFCTGFGDYSMMHPQTKAKGGCPDYILEQLMNTGDFGHDPQAAQILAENIYDIIVNRGGRLADLAIRIIALYSRITTLFNGILYSGGHDGECGLVWNHNCVTPVKWFNRDKAQEGEWDIDGKVLTREEYDQIRNSGDEKLMYSMMKPIFKNGRVALDDIKRWRSNNPGKHFSKYGFATNSKNFFHFIFIPDTIYSYMRFSGEIEKRGTSGDATAAQQVGRVSDAMMKRFTDAVETLDRDDPLWFSKMMGGIIQFNPSVSATKGGYVQDQFVDLSKLKEGVVSSVALADFYGKLLVYFNEVLKNGTNVPPEDNPFYNGSLDWAPDSSNDTTKGIAPSQCPRLIQKFGREFAYNAVSNLTTALFSGKTKEERDFYKSLFPILQETGRKLGLPGFFGTLRGTMSSPEAMKRMIGVLDANYEDRGTGFVQPKELPPIGYERIFNQMERYRNKDESDNSYILDPMFLGGYVYSCFKAGRPVDVRMVSTIQSAYGLFDDIRRGNVNYSRSEMAGASDRITKINRATVILYSVLQTLFSGGTKYDILEKGETAFVGGPTDEFDKYIRDVVRAIASQM